MKHTKITVGFATLLCIFSLAGCQSKPQNQPVETETEMQQTNTVSEPQTEQPQQESSETHPNNVPASAEELLNSATVSGEVTAFSDTDLTLNPLSTTDAGLPSWPLIQKMRKISLLSTIWKTARSSLPASTNLLEHLHWKPQVPQISKKKHLSLSMVKQTNPERFWPSRFS